MIPHKNTGMSEVNLQAEHKTGKDFGPNVRLDGDRLHGYVVGYRGREGAIL